MGLKERFKDFISASDEDYIDSEEEVDTLEYEPRGYEPEMPPFNEGSVATKPEKPASPKVVDIRSSSRPYVVVKKLDRFEEVGEVADVLNEKRIVILNLETCQNDISRRIIDFLYGVAYANSGEIRRIAGRAFIITPNNVPVTGEMLDSVSGDDNLPGSIF